VKGANYEAPPSSCYLLSPKFKFSPQHFALKYTKASEIRKRAEDADL